MGLHIDIEGAAVFQHVSEVGTIGIVSKRRTLQTRHRLLRRTVAHECIDKRPWLISANESQPVSGVWLLSPVRVSRRREKSANYFAKIMLELTPFPTCAIGRMAHGGTSARRSRSKPASWGGA
jgi:hypothetical protein